jgi:tripartite-type tricarboxylate transporter receptor subunit TctC
MAAGPDPVEFRDGDLTLKGILYRPDGNGPFPVIVAMHDCGGLFNATGGIGAHPAVSRVARAQAYPTRPVRIVVGFAAGGAGDIFARLIGQWLSDKLGQPYIVEDRPGAGGNISTEAVVRARADGYTLHLASTADTVNATLYDKLNFSFVHDIAPVASIMRTPLVVVVNPSVPVKTVAELISYAKANPRRLNMGSAGIGSPPHVCR